LSPEAEAGKVWRRCRASRAIRTRPTGSGLLSKNRSDPGTKVFATAFRDVAQDLKVDRQTRGGHGRDNGFTSVDQIRTRKAGEGQARRVGKRYL